MTELLYLNDSYIKKFDATVREVNGRFIVLDKTAFYPQGGGQPSDIGLINDNHGKTYRVNFVKRMGGVVTHEVDAEGMMEGEIVRCEVDWERRHLLMRYHTAAHILAAVIHSKTGAQITGNQLDISGARVDFNLAEFDREKIQEYAKEVNEIISRNVSVEVKEMPREEAFRIPAIVKLKMFLPESLETIRVVTIHGIDQQACAGTHVSNTREIGMIEVTKAENKGAENRRVYFILRNY